MYFATEWMTLLLTSFPLKQSAQGNKAVTLALVDRCAAEPVLLFQLTQIRVF